MQWGSIDIERSGFKFSLRFDENNNMKNITNKTKTILFTSLIAAMILPFSVMDFAEAKQADKDTHGKEIRSLFADIDKDIKEYVKSDMQDPNAKKAELKSKHADKLDRIVSKVANKVDLQFTTDEKDDLKDLIVREHIKELKRQKIVSQIPIDAVTEVIEIGGLSTQGYFELPIAYATGNPYPITSWKQVTIDRDGGSGTDSSGNDYDIDGGNDFTTLSTSYTSTKVTYTLTFDGEDHPDPDTDDWYDSYRQAVYGRSTDIESFTVDSNGIDFSGIWDEDKTFGEWYGQHGDQTRTYSSGVSIYVSNVWNHAMDTSNENSSMSITSLTT